MNGEREAYDGSIMDRIVFVILQMDKAEEKEVVREEAD